MADRIQSFFSGATGFLGKPLVEKLLRAAPDIGQITLLIRSKRDGSGNSISSQERFEREVLSSGAFDLLREQWGRTFAQQIRSKLSVVNGDISMDRLGLSDEDYTRLTQSITLVINSAAVVVFDERLDAALNLNTLATERIATFANDCRDAALVHVSTAYVNGQNPDLAPEALIPTDATAPAGWKGPRLPDDLDGEIAELMGRCREVETASREPLQAERFARDAKRNADERSTPEQQREVVRERWVREQLIQIGMERAKSRGWHDTYTYTKAMGERRLGAHRGDLPVVIVRPSIIESSLNEPEPGWIDGYRMADPIIVSFAKGRVDDFPAKREIVIDIIPVDHVVNAMLAAAAIHRREDGLKVFHVSTGNRNPLSFQALYDSTRRHFIADPMLDKSGRPISMVEWTFPELKTFHRRIRWGKMFPLAVAQRLLTLLPSAKTRRRLRYRLATLQNAVERLYYYTVIYEPYIRHTYLFDTAHTEQLFASLTEEEREAWSFDVGEIDWTKYVESVHIPGLKRNVLKMDQSRLRQRIAEDELLDERAPDDDTV